MSIFEKASKMKLRFETLRGLVTVEDLWDMPLVDESPKIVFSTPHHFSLDVLAKSLNRQLEEAEEESFVKPHNSASTSLSLALDIVKRVIEVKLKNIETQNKKAATIARNGRIMEALVDLENKELTAKSKEELLEMLEDD